MNQSFDEHLQPSNEKIKSSRQNFEFKPIQKVFQGVTSEQKFQLKTTDVIDPVITKQERKTPLDETECTLPLVIEAKNILKRGLIYSQKSKYEEKNAEYLNDVAHFGRKKTKFDNIKNTCLRDIFISFFSLINKLDEMPVLGPYDNLRLLWDLLQFICILFLLFWVPIELGFSIYLPDDWYHTFFYFFCADMLVNINTAYIANGHTIKNRRQIFSNYLKNDFFMDALSSICFALNHPLGAAKHGSMHRSFFFALQWIFFFRIRNLRILYNKFLERVYCKMNVRESYIDLLNLIFIICFIIQIFACFWHFIGYYDGLDDGNDSKENWLKNAGIDYDDIQIRFLYSFYWSAVTIMTVGYGDILPQNNTEIIFTIFSVCVGCGVMAYMISCIGNIANKFNHDMEIYKENLHVMNKFMNRKKISPDLQMKVRQYLRFIWQEELTQNAALESEIISKLSKTLRDELYSEANGLLLNKYSMFFANFSDQMLRSLMHLMRDARFNPGDTIFKENEADDNEIYFLLKGKVKLTIQSNNRFKRNSKKVLGNISGSGVFGELSFFSGQYRTATAQSLDFSSVLYLRREDFLETLKRFPVDYERFCKIRDQILNKNYMAINFSCAICHNCDHLFSSCPLLHFNKEFCMMKQRFPGDQKVRRFVKRGRKRNFNSLFHLTEIRKKSLAFQDESSPEKNESFIQKSDFLEVPENDNFSLSEVANERILELNSIQIFSNEHKLKNPSQKSLIIINHSPEKRTNAMRKMNSSYTPKIKQSTEDEAFEKHSPFNHYYPERNKKQKSLLYEKIYSQTPNEKKIPNIWKKKFLNFFLEKAKSAPRKKLTIFQRIQRNFFRKKLAGSKIGEKLMTDGDIRETSFFDVVYEVMTNEELRSVLIAKKIEAMKRKKIRSKNLLI